MFHVSSSRNRQSILEHGLDWSRMGEVRGIAGSNRPEAQGCFLCRDRQEADWFVAMNNTGGSVDIWAIENVDVSDLVDAGSGYYYVPGIIPRNRITLTERDLPGATIGKSR